MCLATTGTVISIEGDNAVVDFGGVRYEINISLVKPKIGDRVLVHAGFAIQIMKDDENVCYT
ncbi:MAG: HypC/HybG/HupF family hydrogenase formation chaperone [Candidatus Micrarchaeota archaeon]|nr:HypC/HybG/HupF family hydrogenase formation chaperone [Candidatus Micrarchaeota archaeon]